MQHFYLLQLMKRSRFVLVSSFMLLTMLLSIGASAQCNNLTSGGSIASDQTVCMGGDPAAFTSISDPSGGSGALQIIWMYKSASTNWNLTQIAGATGMTYDPGPVYEETYFRRCARRQGCSSYDGESNDCHITIGTCPTCNNVTSGGQVGSNQTGCVGFDSSAFTSISSPTGGSGTLEIIWIYKSASTGWAFQPVSGATALTYNPGSLNETTIFRRCARRAGCTTYAGESNDITITITGSCNECSENVYNEYFSDANGTTSNGNFTSSLTGFPANGETRWFQEVNGKFEANNTDAEALWTSSLVNISGLGKVQLMLNLESAGGLENSGDFMDYIRVYYKLDGGTEVPFALNGNNSGVIPNSIALQNGISGSTVQIVVRTLTTSADEFYRFDNVRVISTGACDIQDSCVITGYDSPIGRIFWIPAFGTDFAPIASMGGIHFDQFTNGKAHMYGVIQSISDNNKKFVVDLWFANRSTYTQWITQGKQPHSPELGDETQWIFYNWSTSTANTLIGQGSLSGTSLNLANQMATFGLQIGNGANALNANPNGISGWFSYTGTASGNGDINGTINCTPPCTGNCPTDNTPPVFVSVPANVTVSCGQPIPNDQPVVTENCSTATVTMTEEIITDQQNSTCQIVDGNLHTLYLSGPVRMAIGLSTSDLPSVTPGTFIRYSDGTAHATGVVKDPNNANKKIAYDFWLRTKRNYSEWTSIPAATPTGFREPKLDAGTSVTITNEYLGWDYYEMDPNKPNTLIGQNALAGLSLTIAHFPLDYRYAVQVGDRGSLQSIGEGLSSWIWVTGSWNGTNIANQGDFNFGLTNCVENPPVVNCTQGYIIHRTWTAVDACGNESTASQNITVVGDNAAPTVVSAPANVTIQCDQALPTDAPVFTDNCDMNLDIAYSEQTVSQLCGHDLVQTWIATDDCGNYSTVTRTIHVVDTVPPAITNVPADVTVNCGETIPNDQPTITDNCSTPTVTFTETIISDQENNTCQIVDGSLHTLYLSGPVRMAIGLSTSNLLSVTPGTFVRYSDGTAHATGLVKDPNNANKKIAYDFWLRAKRDYSQWTSIPAATPSGFREPKLNAGNTVTITNEYLGWDYYEMDPTKTNSLVGQNALAGLNLTIAHFPLDFRYAVQVGDRGSLQSLGEGLSSWIWVTGSWNGTNIADQGDFNFGLTNCVENPPVVTCQESYIIERTWLAVDACGNSSIAVQNITVGGDNLSPFLVSMPSDITIECSDAMPIDAPVFDDNCDDELTITTSISSTIVGCTEVVTMTWTATDDCGNSNTAVRHITIADTTAPTAVTAPSNVTIECDETLPTDAATFSDNCDNNVEVVYSQEIITLACGYDLIQTWTGYDNCENNASVSRTIHVVDTTLPTLLNVPSDVTVECDEIPEAPVVTAHDNCTTFIQVSFDETSGSGCDYYITRTWTAHDDCNNVVSATQYIHVLDTTAPVLHNVPSDITVECGENIPSIVVNATDNCDEFVNVDLSAETIDTGCGSLFIRTWTAMDDCGNISTASQTVTIIDTTAPVATYVPASISLECDELYLEDHATFYDECDNDLNVDFTSYSATEGCTEVITQTWTATDECNNFVTVSRTITITDTTAPIAHDEPQDITIECDEALPTDAPSFTDNCDTELEYSYDSAEAQEGCNHLVSQVWSAADDCGNTTTVYRTITIVDTNAPIALNVPQDITVECDEALPTDAPSFTDNCDTELEYSYDSAEAQEGCNHLVSQVWSAADDCGNTTTVYRTITIVDTTAPIAHNVPQNITIECDEALPTDAPSFTDNCDAELEYSNDSAEAQEGCYHLVFQSWFATDDCGNTTTVYRTITIVDTTAPVATYIPDSVTIECDQELPTDEPVFIDNCDTNIHVEAISEIAIVGCTQVISQSWIASDDCDNTTIVSRSITIVDTAAPYTTWVPENVTIECDQALPTDEAMFADNCDEDLTIVYTPEYSMDGCYQLITQTWTATDNCDNTVSVTRVITVVDTIAPYATYIPENVTIECDEAMPTDEPIFMDNCDMDIHIEAISGITTDGCIQIISQSWIASDDCNNTVIISRSITIVDTTAPYATYSPENVTVECDEALPTDAPSFDDNCDDSLSYTSDSWSEVVGCNEIITQLWTATDNCDNSVSIYRTITVVDTTAPVLHNLPASVIAECDAVPAVSTTVTADDNCDEIVDITYSEIVVPGDVVIEGAAPCGYAIERTWVATDDCGNESSYTQIVTVVDTHAPVLVGVPANQDVECDNIPAPFEVTAYDNCDNDVSIVFEQTYEYGSGCSYLIYRTWTATDNCGNISTATQTMGVYDHTDPELTNVPSDITVECDAVPAAVEVGATDNCDQSLEVVFTEEMIQDGCNYQLIRTWYVEDDCYNSSSATQVITVVDTTAPVLFGVPQDTTMECDQPIGDAIVSAIDNCDSSIEVVLSAETILQECGYLFVRTWTVSDDCGNTTVSSQTITVLDTTSPVILTSPDAEITVECDQPIPFIAPTFEDNCDMELEINAISGLNNVTDCGYDIERSWIAADDCGNTTTFSQVVHVVDTTAPVLHNVPSNATFDCGSVPDPAAVTASDNCDLDVTVVLDQQIEGICPYTITRTWTATDICGNYSTAVQVITVIDTIAPVLSGVPADINEQCIEIPTPAVVTASDNCDSVVAVAYSQEIVSESCPIHIIRTWTASDDCGNEVTAEQHIYVDDTIAPVLHDVPANSTVECDAVPAPVSVTATDNCTVNLEVTYDQEYVQQGCNYQLIRTWSATDFCGNQTSAMQIITVIDSIAPVLTGSDSEITLECNVSPTIVAPTATDNCDNEVEITPSFTSVEGDCANAHTEIYSWTATDNCGNTSVRTLIFHFVDTTAPILNNVPADSTVECNEVPAPADVTASDNCDMNLEVVYSQDLIQVGCNYQLIRTWTVSDDCDNTSSATQVLTVVDTTAPVLHDVPADATIECTESIVDAIVWATDNCDESIIVSVSAETILQECGYLFVRTWTAADDCGNEVSATQTITVVDTTVPYITSSPSAELTIECDDAVPTDAPTFADSCDDSLEYNAISGFSNVSPCGYDIERSWFATDNCGNTTSFSQVIHVVDTTAPIITAEIELFVSCDDIPETFVAATDNCSDEVTVEFTDLLVSGGCQGRIIRTYTATDGCGNTSTFEQILTLVDTTVPTIAVEPEDMTIECDQVIPSFTPSFADNCDDELEVVYTYTEEFLNCGYVIHRVWTATDNCQNHLIVTQDITVIDTTAPILVGVPEDANYDCVDVPTAPVVTAEDNCSEGLEVVFTEESTPLNCGYQVTRTWYAVDACGNEVTATQVIVAADITAPILYNTPEDVTIECGNSIPSPSTAIYALDNCTVGLIVSHVDTTIPADCGYSIDRVYTAQDACGNSVSYTQTITIVDTTDPMIIAPADVTVDCGSVPSVPTLVATDNCDNNVTVQYSEVETTECPRQITRTWIATDDCGNSTTVSQVITVVDEVNPVFDPFPVYIEVECDQVAAYTITANDNCDASVDVSIIEELVFSGACYGTLQRTYKAIDDCGNFVTAIQLVNIVDNIAPVIENTPTDVTVYCDDAIPAVSESVIATDNCDSNVELTMTQTQTGDFCPYDIIRVWTAIDECGNITTAQQVIHVTVNVQPQFALNVYPSPADGNFTVEFSNVKPGKITSGIYDMNGKKVADIMNNQMDSGRLYRFFFSADQFDAGTYMVIITTEQEVYHRKFIVAGKR